MKNKAFWGSALTVVWFVVFAISSVYGLFIAPPYRTLVEGIPLYISYFTIANLVPTGLMLLFTHYLVFTNQANANTISNTTAMFLCWAMLMIFDAVDPAWWITRIILGGLLILGLEVQIPDWPHRLSEFAKEKFSKKEKVELPKTRPNDDRWYK